MCTSQMAMGQQKLVVARSIYIYVLYTSVHTAVLPYNIISCQHYIVLCLKSSKS